MCSSILEVLNIQRNCVWQVSALVNQCDHVLLLVLDVSSNGFSKDSVGSWKLQEIGIAEDSQQVIFL